jgi:hypothetical protein
MDRVRLNWITVRVPGMGGGSCCSIFFVLGCCFEVNLGEEMGDEELSRNERALY